MSSMIGVRVNIFNENFLNETDQDANSVLTELDKGLRSVKIGEQCEAIVRFPRLFEKYPFPILINSSFLKLAEFFRIGSNLLRLWVLKVCQQSEKHLDKILNIDEFVRRIYMVIHSNDPVARALTLRTLGAVARVIPEKQQVHHSIRRALDSHDIVEIEAAIYASVQFAAQSKTFAISMCSKIGTMIQSLKTPVNMKLQLIPVLHHMHRDANTAGLVKTLCLELLTKYPTENFVITILDSLTKLSCKTLVDIPDQVNLLLSYFNDPRERVRLHVLKSLKSLAKEGAHLWPNGTLKSLISAAQTCSDLVNEQRLVLTVVLTLTECHVACHSLLNEEQNLILELCSSCLVLEHHIVASQALRILTALIHYCYTGNITPSPIFMDLINLHLKSLIYSSVSNEKTTKELRQYLKSGIILSETNTEFGEDFVQLIGEILTDDFECVPKHSVLLCGTLAALSSQFQIKRFSDTNNIRITLQTALDQPSTSSPSSPSVATSVVASSSSLTSAGGTTVSATSSSSATGSSSTSPSPLSSSYQFQLHQKRSNPVTERLSKILKKIDTIIENELKDDNIQIIETLSAVVLQSIIGCFMPITILNVFERIIAVSNYWTQYRIARSASRYGQHFLAAKIYSQLSNHVSLDKFHFFLISLMQISKAECVLNYGFEYEIMLCNYHLCDPKYHHQTTTTKIPSMSTSTTSTTINSGQGQGNNNNDDATNNIKLLSLTERIDKAISLYWKALASIKASSSPTNPLQFQSEFIKLRGQYLQALFNVVIAKNTQSIIPPPAIATTLAQNSRDYLQKFGHITNQLRKCVKSIKSCEDSFSKLYKSSFDADPTTLEFLEIMQHQCSVLSHIVETICYVSPSESPIVSIEGKYPETKYFLNVCRAMEKYSKNFMVQDQTNAKIIGNKHTDLIVNEVEIITKAPVCIPRFFFQVIQNTTIKLSISPLPRVSGEPIIVQPGSNLVVKVEGVIQHYGKSPSLYRSVKSVQLTLTSQLITQRNNNDLKQSNDTITLTQIVKPHRDFLSGNFLLPLNNNNNNNNVSSNQSASGVGSSGMMNMPMSSSVGGHWQVTLETFVIDENDTVWCTGPKNSLIVRVPDDPSKQTANSTQPRRF